MHLSILPLFSLVGRNSWKGGDLLSNLLITLYHSETGA